MKKMLLFVLKTGLFIFFIYNLGVIDYVSNMEKTPSPPIKNDLIAEEEISWLNEKYENALKLGALYSPELYFANLTEIQIKLNKNQFDRRTLPLANGTISNLAYLFHKNFQEIRSKNRFNSKEVLDYMQRIGDSSLQYEEILQPGITEKRKLNAEKTKNLNYWFELFTTFLLWILKQYLKNLIPSFILLWIWWYQEKETVSIKNPLSFIFCLIIYPIVIIKTWKDKLNNQARYLLMTVEYRSRQLDLFSLFSENEIKEIRNIARSNISLGDYRNLLEKSGLTVKHSFAVAMSATVLIIILGGNNSYSQNFDSNINDLVKIEQMENSPPGVYIVSCCLDFEAIKLFLKQDLNYYATLTNRIIKFFDRNEKCLKGFERGLMHIPKMVINNNC